MTDSVVSCASAVATSKVMPDALKSRPLAASAAPTRTVVVPSSVVEVRLVTPAMVVAVAPNAMEVEPTVTVLFAKLELAIDEPVDNKVPVLSGKVSVRSAVGFATVRTVSLASALEPSKVIPDELRTIPSAASAAPARTVVVPSRVVEVSEVRPATVVAVAPN